MKKSQSSQSTESILARLDQLAAEIGVVFRHFDGPWDIGKQHRMLGHAGAEKQSVAMMHGIGLLRGVGFAIFCLSFAAEHGFGTGQHTQYSNTAGINEDPPAKTTLMPATCRNGLDRGNPAALAFGSDDAVFKEQRRIGLGL